MSELPMQPMLVDEYGAARFRANAVVRLLLEESRNRGFGLNELPLHDLPQADVEQFYQLIGYLLSGYHELSLVSDEAAHEASRSAEAAGARPLGCRVQGCPIHTGVKREP